METNRWWIFKLWYITECFNSEDIDKFKTFFRYPLFEKIIKAVANYYGHYPEVIIKRYKRCKEFYNKAIKDTFKEIEANKQFEKLITDQVRSKPKEVE